MPGGSRREAVNLGEIAGRSFSRTQDIWEGAGRFLAELALALHVPGSDSQEIFGLHKYPIKKLEGRLPDHFALFSKPVVMTGEMSQSPVIFYGPLALTGHVWRTAGSLIHSTGSTVELRSLEGHEGTWESILNTTHKNWTERIIKDALALLKAGYPKPIVVGCSTSGLAVLQATTIRPDIFGACVVAAPPIELRKGPVKSALVGAAAVAKEAVPIERGGAYEFSRNVVIPLQLRKLFLWEDLGFDAAPLLENFSFSKLLRAFTSPNEFQKAMGGSSFNKHRLPALDEMPLSKFLDLERLQQQVQKRAPLVPASMPFLFAHAKNDGFCAPETVRDFVHQLPSRDKTVVILEKGSHLPMLHKDRRIRSTFNELIVDWIIFHMRTTD